MKLFTEDDFKNLNYGAHTRPSAAYVEYANEKLKKLIETCTVVYGFANKHGWYEPDTESNEYATHKARLAFIEEIKKEQCAHEPSRITTVQLSVDQPGNEYYTHKTRCQLCGCELVADWKVK